MRQLMLFLLATTTLSNVALAAEDPTIIKGSDDSRIRSIDYSEKTVIRITSTNKIPIVLTYGDGQLPVFIASADVADVTIPDGLTGKDLAEAKAAARQTCEDPNGPTWCVDRHANELTLQPLKDDLGSMLTVTADKTDDAGNKVHYHYNYELRTRDGRMADVFDQDGKLVPEKSHDAGAYFKVTYAYPAEELAKRQAEYRAAHQNDHADKERAKVQDALTLAQFGGQRTFQWTGGDSDSCTRLGKPTRISDNGQFTTLYWPQNTPISIPNRVNDDGTETKLNWHPRKAPDSGDLMVIEEVPKQFVLRRDNDVCLFVRDPKAPMPIIPFTGTSSPDVVREPPPYVRHEARK